MKADKFDKSHYHMARVTVLAAYTKKNLALINTIASYSDLMLKNADGFTLVKVAEEFNQSFSHPSKKLPLKTEKETPKSP